VPKSRPSKFTAAGSIGRSPAGKLRQILRLNWAAGPAHENSEDCSDQPQSLEFPPMQKGASFNMEAVKAQIQAAIAAQTGK
jgi:hypothetical protein